MNLMIERVVYGRDDTPLEDREYVIVGQSNCPVGTVKDWNEFAKKNGFDEVVVLEK